VAGVGETSGGLELSTAKDGDRGRSIERGKRLTRGFGKRDKWTKKRKTRLKYGESDTQAGEESTQKSREKKGSLAKKSVAKNIPNRKEPRGAGGKEGRGI